MQFDSRGADLNDQKIGDKLKDLKLKTEVPESSNTKVECVFVGESHETHIVPQKMDEAAVGGISIYGMQDLRRKELTNVEGHKEPSEESEASRGDASGNEVSVAEVEQKLTSLEEKSDKIRYKIENLRSQEKQRVPNYRHIEEEYELLKAAVEMAFDDQHPADFHIEQLNAQVDAKKRNLVELESRRDAFRKTLEEKQRTLEESLYATKPEVREKYQKLKEVKLEMQSVLSEIRKREEEHSKLSADVKKQPKVANRRSYIQRITEITKNSRKQDADIERILKETRELQLESNSIQERLHRTYAVVDETVFREAKKDPVVRQAYRLLTSIHDSFRQISEKILATDRTRREVAEHEAKLAAMASRSLNVEKLQADLDAIRRENEYLEQHPQDN
ncbi:hypothetical protein L1049_000709 [Liquidambar formosana]|uniref:CCDC22 coiled-coil domain-containing protein n=1 Tax=Liquidambar formosana TaxID=63359 RepID=A0AAP0NA75_LIQFO